MADNVQDVTAKTIYKHVEVKSLMLNEDFG